MARWCFRHRLVVLLLWVGALLGLGTGSGVSGADYSNVFSLPGTDSTRASELLTKAFPERGGDTDTIVWRAEGGSVRDPVVRAGIEPALAEIARMPGVGELSSPYEKGPAAAAQISGEGHIAFAQLTFTEQANAVPKKLVEDVVDTARAAQTDGLKVELGGQAITRTQEPPTGVSEIVGIVAAAIVLFLAFGSLFSMSLPIVVAIFGVGTGLSATTLLSHVTDVPEVAPLLGSLIGLGVGIDYALFIVTRHRRSLLRGRAPEDSAVTALNTSGRAVLFAGGTVCIALAGMLVMNMRFLDGVVLATSLTVVMSVLAAITLLPAMLGLLGPRVLSRRQRRRLAAEGPAPAETRGLAARWASCVQRRPRSLALLAVTVMAVLAVPVLSLRLGATDQGNHGEDTTTRQAYDLLAEGFGPGFNGPLQVVVEGAETADLVRRLGETKGVAQVAAAPAERGVTVIQVVPTTSPQDAETDRLIDALREDVIPTSGARAHVGGVTAVFKDFSTVTGERLPYFVAAIIGLGFVLLMIAFRSLLVPLTAALMNLVAAAASFGVLVAVFQWGWGAEALGVGKEGPIAAFLPVIMLSLLFGLSMDYQVFLVSRMHEEWVHTRDNARAVRVGLAESSRVITCAALIMICVFSAFVLSGDVEGAMAGGSLAAAVALDAFVLRMALVPAMMHLLGRANWWLPGRLDKRMPHLAVEPADVTEAGSQRPYADRGSAPPGPRFEDLTVQEASLLLRQGEGLPERAGADEAPNGSAKPADDELLLADDSVLKNAGSGPGGEPRRGRNTDATQDLRPGPRVVHGAVRTGDGRPAVGSVLTLMSTGGRQLDRSLALSDGSYLITAPASGTYLLAVTAHGQGSDARHITVGDVPLMCDINLVREEAGAMS
ncbi:MMPL family transporter [Streptomyces sp. NA04227]|uniref:MMPL family transporter n=1 Tax=Streptomyces sp. NA04227 TaxID=2742136 RepID=UPI0015925615|nr:MMPL family transporter [Streptomyces sp. NA04227]QKW11095.1 MMPL family transporter [Streptomyces sp. NA04227]